MHKHVVDTVPEEEGKAMGLDRLLLHASPRSLLRFLIARNFDIAKATDMMQKAIVSKILSKRASMDVWTSHSLHL